MNTRKEVQRMTFEGADEMAAEIERLKAELGERIIEMPTMTIAEHTIKHQAAEIKRLEAERDAAFEEANIAVLDAASLQAQLTEAHAALEEISRQKLSGEMHPEDYEMADFQGGYEACVKCARQALATDGKAAADVLAAAEKWARMLWPDGVDPRDIAPEERHLYEAVRAYRKEGQGDG